MISRARSCLFLIGLLGSLSALAAGSDFTRPKDYLGPTNSEGKICKWFELGEIRLADETSLPFRLRFSSQPQKGSPVFGKFWWCPLLESTLVSDSENSCLLSTLGGRLVKLRKGKTGEWSSGDGQWQGTLSWGEIIVSGPDGWKYAYQKGRLITAEKGDAIRLKWVFAEDRPVAIENERGVALFRLSYGRNKVIPSAMDIGKVQCRITEQSIPTMVSANGLPVIGAFEASLSGIITPWRWWTFPVELQREGVEYHLAYSDTGTVNEGFVWQAVTGLLENDGGHSYFLKQRDKLPLLVSRKDAQGRIESYFYNAKTGTSEHCKPDGETVVRNYFVARGPTQKQIRKMTQFRDGKEIGSAQWSYDERGRLVRIVSGEYEKYLTWHDSGKLASFQELWDGGVYREKKFSDAGDLLSWREGKQLLEYQRSAGEVVMKKTVDGVPVVTQVKDLANNVERVLVPGKEGGPADIPLFDRSNFPPGIPEQTKTLLTQ